VLYRTLGPTLPGGAASAAVLWGAAHRCTLAHPEAVRAAGFVGEGLDAGEQLFDAILAGVSGVVFTEEEPEDSWRRVRDGRADLLIPELVPELEGLATEVPPGDDPEWPFVLSAGERRSFTANTIFRDPAWRKRDAEGALRVAPGDAERLGLADGGRARLTTRQGSAEVIVAVFPGMQPGHVSLPNGMGLDEAMDGAPVRTGVAPNELTSLADRDWLAGTPWHKSVPARLEPAS
jgi:anaerobic selenocysteine-containing dehydrogenase